MYVRQADKLGISEVIVQRQHRLFLAKYKDGFVTKDDFLKVSEEILGTNSNLANALFALFDEGKPYKLLRNFTAWTRPNTNTKIAFNTTPHINFSGTS